jgi:outer membrane autotransporter protein
VWAEAIGSWATFDGGSGVAAARGNTAGGTVGIDNDFQDWRLGVAGSYSQDNIDVADRNSSAVDKTENISLYAGRAWGPLALRLGAGYAWHQIDTSRDELFPGFSDHTTAGFSAGNAQAFGELGYNLAMDGGTVEPFAGLSYDSLTIDHANETGGPSALAVAGQTKDVMSTRLGLRASWDIGDAGDTATPDFTLHGSIAWRHDYDNLASAANLTFEGTKQGFTVNGLPIAQDAAEITAGISAKAGASTRIDLSYSGELADKSQENGVKLLATWLF